MSARKSMVLGRFRPDPNFLRFLHVLVGLELSWVSHTRRQLYPPVRLNHRYVSNRSSDPPMWDVPDLHNAGGFRCFFGGARSAPKNRN